MLTVAQAARVYGVTKATVRSWIVRGHITRSRSGLIDIHELDAWWERRDTQKIGKALQQVG